MKLRVVFASLLMAALGMTFASAAAPQTKATTVTVTMTEFKFKLSRASVPHGKVTFKLVNKGKLQHDFSIAGHTSKKLNPGTTGTLTVTLKKGLQAYKCTVAGHAAAGMKGKLKVT